MTDIQNLKMKITPIAARHGVKRVSLFGSRARGDDRIDSDYDFVISKGAVDSIFRYVAFVDDLEGSLGAHVDVITDTSEDEDFLREIKKDEVLLYES